MTLVERLRTLAGSPEEPDRARSPRLPRAASSVRHGLLRRRRRGLADSPGDNGVPRRGRIGFLRPGFNNLGPSGPFVFRYARRFDVTVLAYACDGGFPRVADVVDGAPVPADLAGRVYTVGSPAWCILSFEAASDLFLRQLLALADAGLPGLDPDTLLAGGATFLGHSQGALEGLIDAARLEGGGLRDALAEIVAIAPPLDGSSVLGRPAASALMRQSAGAAAGGTARRAVDALVPGAPAQALARHGVGPEGFARVVAGSLGRRGSPMFRTLAWLADRRAGWEARSDGLVAVESARRGVPDDRFVLLDDDLDHDELFELPHVVDAALS